MKITTTTINYMLYRFKSYEFINKTNFQTTASRESVSDAVSKVASEIIIFAVKHQHKFQPLDD